jgi:hypothetical protein
MRLYISTLSKRFVHSATYTALLDGFTFKRHDVEPIELHFLDENGLVEIPAKFISKALFVAGSYDEFNGKYLPTGSSENGKPVWEKAGIKIKYVSENTYAVSAAIVTNAQTYFLNGKYLPDTILNGKTCYKNTATQNRFEWKPAETPISPPAAHHGFSDILIRWENKCPPLPGCQSAEILRPLESVGDAKVKGAWASRPCGR